jgi:hypothetical protein
LTAACSSASRPAVTKPEGTPASTVAAPQAAGKPGGGFRVVPTCLSGDHGLVVHVEVTGSFNIRPPGTPVGRSAMRTVWQLHCERSGECSGVRFELGDALESGLDVQDLGSVVGARVISSSPAVYVIRWGEWRTITLDLAQRKVLYTESGPTTEGRGEGACGDGPRTTTSLHDLEE